MHVPSLLVAGGLTSSTSTKNRAGVDAQYDIPHYRIAKLFDGVYKGTLCAIGNISSKQQMIVMEVNLSPSLAVRELGKIPRLSLGDDVTAVAVKSGGKARIIVASLTGASRRLIYPKHGQ